MDQREQTRPDHSVQTQRGVFLHRRTRAQKLALILIPLLLAGALFKALIEPFTWQVGAVISIACGAAILYCISSIQRNVMHAAVNAGVMRSLHEISIATLQVRSGGPGQLAPLTRLFAEALGMRTSILLELDPTGETMTVIDHHGLTWHMETQPLSMSQLPITRHCFESGQLYLVEDGEVDSGMFAPEFLRQRGIRSFLLIPLLVRGQPIGAIQLADPRPYRIGQAERRMAEVWAGQAAVLLAHGRLLEQATSDADTKKRLLQELNHRVKNNLAGIVGLLSTCPPGAGKDVRDWLDRIVQRIASMARMHELFLHDASIINLEEVIRQVVTSTLSATTAPVRLQLNLAETDMRLDADRALALAMVLHELCHNATVYALHRGGSLVIRASRAGNERLSIAVEDQPASVPDDEMRAADDPASVRLPTGSGLGLELVRALVQRELRGTFSLGKSDTGTIAELTIPLANGRTGDGYSEHDKSTNGEQPSLHSQSAAG